MKTMQIDALPDPDDVFIPGGMPEDTYVTREHLNIEASLIRWSRKRQRPLLSVSGPTKSGKTVLLRKVFPEAYWLSGGAIDGADDFWDEMASQLEVFTEHGLAAHASHERGGEFGVKASAGVAEAGIKISGNEGADRSLSRSRSESSRSAVRRELRRLINGKSSPTIIIDDFHYVDSGEQLLIIRALKDLIFEGLGVIVAAVPHRAYDVVRVEKEMTARVTRVEVPDWRSEDLRLIATQGYAALHVQVANSIVDEMVSESFQSPYLMQTHCLQLCEENATSFGHSPDHEPWPVFVEPDWEPFFRQQASGTSKSAFDLLKTGPSTRTDRKLRELKSGTKTDIYGAVLAAIEETGARTSLSYEEIRTALRDILKSDLPQKHEVTNVLNQMTKIAKEKIEGEPIIEYDGELSTLHIVDPYFAYYLRWAPASVKAIDIPPTSMD